MFSDLIIYRSARLLIDQFGLEADFEAAFRADKMLAKGDVNGQNVWRRIYHAVRQLKRTTPMAGQTVN